MLPEIPLIVHASCVHTAVTAVNVSCAVRETSTFAAELLTNAALPTAASGDAVSIVSDSVPAAAVALIVVRFVALLGDVELPPPHACHIAPAATNDAA